jgi:hypothetical protein
MLAFFIGTVNGIKRREVKFLELFKNIQFKYFKIIKKTGKE